MDLQKLDDAVYIDKLSVLEQEFANSIPDGHKNAVSANELKKKFDLQSKRDVFRIVESLRKHGYPIIASSQKGYYYPETAHELRIYVTKLRRRLRSENEILQIIEKRLSKWEYDE